jgi:DHA2 family multidrug resistance protein
MKETDSTIQIESWHPKSNPWLITIAVMLAATMEVLDTSVANVSLPHIAGNLSASNHEATWVLTSYLVANAIILPASAWFGSFFGRKRVLLACIFLFTVSSVLCGIAGSLGQLILFRIFQGLGGGALQPISQAILVESFPKEKRMTAMAVFAMGVIVAPIVGPVLGGWLTDNFSWRWIFFINIPVGVVAIIMAQMFVEDPPYIEKIKSGIDYYGFSLMIIGLGMLQIVLDKGQEVDWFQAAWLCWASALVVVSFAVFVFWEFRVKHPVIDLRVLKDRNLVGGMVIAFLMGAILYGTMALAPLFYQTMMGYTAYLSGVIIVPLGVGACIGAIGVSLLGKYIDNKLLLVMGLILIGTASLFLGNITLQVSSSSMIIPFFFLGFGSTTVFVPLATMAFGTLPAKDVGTGSGLFNLTRNIGGSVGIAISTTMLARMGQTHQSILVEQLTPFNSLYQQALMAKPGVANALMYQELLRQSNFLAYVDCFRWYGLLAFFCVSMIFLFKKVKNTESVMLH